MVKMTADEWMRVRDAVLIWVGWGKNPFPEENEKRLVEHFGRDEAVRLLPILRELADEFDKSEARLATHDVSEMGRIASEEFKRKFPEIPHEAVKALAWGYMYANK
jgi:hypothetical protein